MLAIFIIGMVQLDGWRRGTAERKVVGGGRQQGAVEFEVTGARRRQGMAELEAEAKQWEVSNQSCFWKSCSPAKRVLSTT